MLPANLQVRTHRPPDHAGVENVMMMLVCEKVIHVGRQYTNGSRFWQEAKSVLLRFSQSRKNLNANFAKRRMTRIFYWVSRKFAQFALFALSLATKLKKSQSALRKPCLFCAPSFLLHAT